MRWLPPITIGGTTVRVPLAAPTANSLLEVLLAHDADQQTAALENLLTQDSALLVWSLGQAASRLRRDWRTTRDVAQWLAPVLVNKLASLDSQASSLSADQATAAIDIAAASVGLSELAVRLTIRQRSLAPEQVRFAALLQSTRPWLALAKPDSLELDDAALQAWLPECCPLLETQNETTPDDPLLDCLGQAVSLLSDPEAVSSSAVRAANRQRRQLATRWKSQDSESLEHLLSLVAQLVRLDALEHRFAETLEREKIESLRQLAYGAGHEINNPLANISARAQTLLKGETNPERRRRLAAINAQAFRAHEMIADLMLFARPPKLGIEAFDLIPWLGALVEELAPEAERQETQLLIGTKLSSATLHADPVQLAVAVRALCTNSLEALGRGGLVQLDVHDLSTANDQPTFEIVVTDDGPGIAAEVRRHLFDPFYSGREAGRGLGFGLSKCWQIVTQHGGTIDVESPSTGGAIFRLRIPSGQENREIVNSAKTAAGGRSRND